MISSVLAFLLFLQASPSTPEHFFTGRTEGQGTVHVIMSGSHPVRDRAVGRVERGALLLEQVVEEEGKPARRRSWRLVRSGAHGLTGTISDARGPVTGEIAGNVLTLSYRSAEGPWVAQTITLHANGRTASNRMRFSRFGVTVATVETTIRRID